MDGSPDRGPCWVDLMSSDPLVAQRFYSALFGWDLVQTEYLEPRGYSMFWKNGVPVAGLGSNSSGFTDSWTTYMAVQDVEVTLIDAVKHRGTVLMPSVGLGGLGTLAVIMGPGKAVVGLWETATLMAYQTPDAAGFALWHTLNSYRFDEVFNFYCTVLGWRPHLPAQPTSIRYATFQTGGGIRAVIFDAAAAGMRRPSRWWVSFGVPDVEAASRQIIGLGGRVVVAPIETPFGPMALVADPSGAEFYLAEPGHRPLVLPKDPWDISWVTEL